MPWREIKPPARPWVPRRERDAAAGGKMGLEKIISGVKM